MRTAARVAALGLTVGVAAGPAGCVQDPMPFDPRRAQDWERADAPQQAHAGDRDYDTAAPARPDGGPSTRPARPTVATAPVVRMTLQEIIHRTVANSLDIRVAGFDTAIDQTRVVEADANFDPQFFSDVSFERVDKGAGGGDAIRLAPGTNVETNSPTNASGGSIFQTFISRVDQEALTKVDFGFRQNTASGGTIEVKQEVDNNWFFPIRSLYNPYYEDDLTVTLNQPLLRNFGVAVNAARITIARNTQRISLLDFRKTVEETVLRAEQLYWELEQTERDVDTERRLVRLSEDTADLLSRQARSKGQPVSAAEVDQAKAQTEARRGQLIADQARLGDISDQLKVLMNDPAYPVSSAVRLTPGDDFLVDELHFNVDDAVVTALENRYELGQQQVRIDSSEIAVDVARNGLLPSLTAQLQGTVDGLNRKFDDTFEAEGQFNRIGFQAGLQFQLPIGNRAARAVWQRSLLQRLQAIAGYGSEIEKVTADVTTAARAVRSSFERLRTIHRSVAFYQQLLATLDQQVQAGQQGLDFAFIFNLLQDQEQLAGQERAEHQAANDYNYAIAQLEGAKGTLLRYNNVLMEQEQLPFDLKLPGSPDPRPTPPGYPYPDRVAGPLSPDQ